MKKFIQNKAKKKRRRWGLATRLEKRKIKDKKIKTK
jgi:hypothetical protein